MSVGEGEREKERKEGSSPDAAHSPSTPRALVPTPASLTPPEEACCSRNGLGVIVSAFHRFLPAKKSCPFSVPGNDLTACSPPDYNIPRASRQNWALMIKEERGVHSG